MRATLLALVILPSAAAAQRAPAPGSLHAQWSEEQARPREEPPPQFQWINYFFVRGVVTNQVGDPTGLRGVSLGPIGSLAGSSTRVGGDLNAYVEQRWIPVVTYAPWFTDGLAAFRFQLEVDFMWGRAANTVQPNEGGGFNADQVNIQTKNVNASIYPTRNPAQLDIVVGTQSVYDTIHDPTTTPLDTLIHTGYKLSFLGSDATGLAVYARPFASSRAKLAIFPLQSAQADKASDDDARLKYAYLVTADWEQTVAAATHVGLSAWRLQDDTEGDAFAYEGLVRSGPAASALAAFTGVPTFQIDRPVGGVWYLGSFFDRNLDFRMGPLGGSGFVMLNAGRYESDLPGKMQNPSLDILGLAANLEVRYRWGSSPGDQLTLQGMFTTGDSDLTDGKYTGVFTLNEYGLPGAVWFTHRTLLMFPFTSTVNNYTGAVTDISNQGYGLELGILTGAWDIIPNKLNMKLGAAFGATAVDPAPLLEMERGRVIGTEVNAELRYTLRYLMTLGLHGGVLFRGSFYEDHPRVTGHPWALFTTYTWYAF